MAAPVLQALTDMVKADMHLLENSEAIKPKELLANLDKLAKEIAEGAEELAKTNKKYKPPKYNPEDDDEDPDKIKYAAEFIKKFFSGEGTRDRQLKFKGQLKEFLWLYSQAIPYLNLDALRETLKNAEKNAINYADDLAKKWKEDAKKRVGNLNFEETQEIVKLLPDNNAKHLLQLQINKLKSATLETVTDVHLMHTRKGFAEATVERIISDYSEIMNQLPSTAYLKVPGVSGKNRHGGGATTSAMKRFQEAINNIAVLNTKLQDAKKKEEKKEDVSKQ
jgi:hypothetical protein